MAPAWRKNLYFNWLEKLRILEPSLVLTSKQVLEATMLAEKPFLDDLNLRSLELGVSSVKFQYYQLSVLLTRSNKIWREECLQSSRSALLLLDELVSHSNDVYNGTYRTPSCRNTYMDLRCYACPLSRFVDLGYMLNLFSSLCRRDLAITILSLQTIFRLVRRRALEHKQCSVQEFFTASHAIFT